MGQRDWGYAPEYVEAMWRMLQRPAADDFVIASGTSHTVTDFLEAAFSAVDLDWREHVEHDPRYVRPSEVGKLVGNPRKARETFGWQATTSVPELAEIMVRHDVAQLQREGLV